MMQSYFAVGAPTTKLPALGSYEGWSRLIRQAIVWTGMVDPCEARLSIEAESDPLYEKRDRLLLEWEQCYETTATTLNQAIQDIAQCAAVPPTPPNQWDDLRGALAAFDPQYTGTKMNTQLIGEAIRAMQGSVIDGRRFVKDGEYRRAAKWKIERFS
jgi:putative DNA primase/helicase